MTVVRRPVDAGSGGGGRLGRILGGIMARDRLVLVSLLALAAAARLPFLGGRGTWDADQGHDMLVLRALTTDGVLPLLGPPTSIGDFHHGALYYYLLAPAAYLSGADPGAVVGAIALAGIAAVGVVWWLARSIGGPVAGPLAGLVAGGLMAVSPAAIETSTFIWNPNLIPLAASIALASAWRAMSGGRAAWWTASIAAGGVVMQLHVLGVVLLPALLAALLADARAAAAREPGGGRGRLLAALAGLAIVALSYLPLIVHELTTGWSETVRVLDYLSGAGSAGEADLDPVQRLLFTTLRVIGWPLVGLITDVPLPGVAAVSAAVALLVWRLRAAVGPERRAMRWLGATLGWCVAALSVLAPSLSTVVAGLPNDHYHAFLDPIVLVTVGLGGAALFVGVADSAGPRLADRSARVVVAIALLALVAFDVGRWPPATAGGGGWPAARGAGERILAVADGRSIGLSGLPLFKTTEGVEFPLRHLGGIVGDAATAEVLVIVCDRLFERIIQADCGGPAEMRLAAASGRFPAGAELVPVSRFDLSSRTSISIYVPPR